MTPDDQTEPDHSPLQEYPKRGDLWQHQDGKTYRVMYVQSSANGGRVLVDLQRVFVYPEQS